MSVSDWCLSRFQPMAKNASDEARILVGKRMAMLGYGFEDVCHVTGLPELKCRLIVGVHGGKHGRADNRPMPEMGSGGEANGDAGT